MPRYNNKYRSMQGKEYDIGLTSDHVDVYQVLNPDANTTCYTPDSEDNTNQDLKDDIKRGFTKKTLLIRYTGEVVEISSVHAAMVRDRQAEGIYYTLNLRWANDTKTAYGENFKSPIALTINQIREEALMRAITAVPSRIHKFIFQYFRFHYGIGPSGDVNSAFDKRNYISPLQE